MLFQKNVLCKKIMCILKALNCALKSWSDRTATKSTDGIISFK